MLILPQKSLTLFPFYDTLSRPKKQGKRLWYHPEFLIPKPCPDGVGFKSGPIIYTMKLITQRTLEKVITGAVVLSLIGSLSTPVLAKTNEIEVPVSETQIAEFPEIQERPVKAVWKVSVTAYSSDVAQNDATPFLPADGKDYRDIFATEGEVRCIALNDLPLGSVVRFTDERITSIIGSKPVKVCDRKNARYNGKRSADLYMYVVDQDGRIDSKRSLDVARAHAKNFGVKRQVTMEILDFGPASKAKAKATVASAK